MSRLRLATIARLQLNVKSNLVRQLAFMASIIKILTKKGHQCYSVNEGHQRFGAEGVKHPYATLVWKPTHQRQNLSMRPRLNAFTGRLDEATYDELVGGDSALAPTE